MGQKWIIQVIADLRVFADQNGLPLLAHQLEVTSTVAQAEIASIENTAQPATFSEDKKGFSDPYPIRERGREL